MQIPYATKAGDGPKMQRIADPIEAARALVERFGADAHEVEVVGLRSDFDAFWAEVDRLLAIPVRTWVITTRQQYKVQARTEEEARDKHAEGDSSYNDELEYTIEAANA